MHKNTLAACLLVLTLGWAAGRAAAQGPKPEKPGKEASSQPKGPGQAKASPEEMLERLTKALDLNNEQRTKVKAILDKSKPEIEKIEAELKAVHERMKKAIFQNKESIRETLTLEQKEKFDAVAMRIMMHRRMQKMIRVRYGDKPGMRRGQGPGMMCGQDGCGMDEDEPGMGGHRERKIIEINERSEPDDAPGREEEDD